ncbi:hypothetical protein [uncultured Duncaniella sp.]|nr:hypothetical protein [uncultured Duncaniella sp.]
MRLRFFLCHAPKAMRDDATKTSEVTVPGTIAIRNIRILIIG